MVKIGTDLLSSLVPFVHVTRSNQDNQRCERCFRTENDLKRCSRCQRIYYCSRQCQTNDWTFHQHECVHLRELDDEYDLIRLFLRFLLRSSKENSSGKGRSIDDLESHQTEIRQDRQRYRTYENIVQQLNQWSNLKDLMLKFDEQRIFLLFCRLVINTLTIHDPIDLKPIGYGLYLEATIYNHSCRPTCHTVFNGIELSVRTIAEASDPNEWTINYVDLLESYEDRQKSLFENYYFHCRCSRCSSDHLQEEILLKKIRSEEEKMDQAINNGQFVRAYQSSEQLIKYYDEILPRYHAYVAQHHVKHLKLALYLAETLVPTQLQVLIGHCLERVQISMGDSHPLTEEARRLSEQYRLEMGLHMEEYKRLM